MDDAIVKVVGALRIVDWHCPVLRERAAENEEVWYLNGEETKYDISNDDFDVNIVSGVSTEYQS